MSWTCKICGRSFRNQNQSHSCNARTIEEAFSKSGQKWFPLYIELLAMARKKLPSFYEYCPSVGVMWKDKSTFAEFKYARDAFHIIFYAEHLMPRRNPIQFLKTSAHRVAHKIAVTDNSNFPEILKWIEESYMLTQSQ